VCVHTRVNRVRYDVCEKDNFQRFLRRFLPPSHPLSLGVRLSVSVYPPTHCLTNPRPDERESVAAHRVHYYYAARRITYVMLCARACCSTAVLPLPPTLTRAHFEKIRKRPPVGLFDGSSSVTGWKTVRSDSVTRTGQRNLGWSVNCQRRPVLGNATLCALVINVVSSGAKRFREGGRGSRWLRRHAVLIVFFGRKGRNNDRYYPRSTTFTT